MGLRIALISGIVLVLIILFHQVGSWTTGALTVSRRQKVFRILEAILLIGVMSMILVGDKSILAHYGKLVAIYYWMACFTLAIVLFVLAMLDIYYVGQHLREQTTANVKKILEDIGEDHID